MLRRTALLLFLSLLPPAGSAAQSIADLSPGDTIRLVQPGSPPTQGILLLASENAVSFQRRRTADTLTLALSSLTRLDVARGRQASGPRMVQGGGMGLLLGALAGAAWEFASAQRGVAVGERDVGIAAGVGGLAGLVIGGLAAAARPVTNWVSVTLPVVQRPSGPSVLRPWGGGGQISMQRPS